MFTFDSLISSQSDQQLWAKIRQGDESAFTQLFERYHRTLFNYGSKLTTHSGVVEDGVQDVFIDIWRLRDTLTSEVISVKFYLYRALRRRIHQAQSKFSATEEGDRFDGEGAGFGEPDAETLLIDQELGIMRAAQVRNLLSKLPERQIEALTLRYFDEFSIEEIASIMGVTDKSVRNFIYKGLSSLRQNGQSFMIPVFILCLLLFF